MINVIKKKFFYYFLILIIFLGIYFLLNFLSQQFIKYNYNLSAIKKNSLQVYKKFYKEINHLRDPLQFNENEIFFSTFYPKDNKSNKLILIQGDSNIENLIVFKMTRDRLQNFSDKNNVTIVVAGISSYSPSLYHVQFRILREFYNLYPDEIITLIDQTDYGDEICRYKNFRKIVNGKLIVEDYNDPKYGRLYYMEDIFKRVVILDSDASSLLKLINISLIKLKYNFLFFLSKNKQICTFDKIQEALISNLNPEDVQYFNDVFDDYLSEITKEIKKITILTHPHRFHIDGHYKFKISDILNIKKFKDKYKISYHEFILSPNYSDNLDNVFIKNDIASHTTEVYTDNVILKKIFEIIKN
jgi:hypothetical protein